MGNAIALFAVLARLSRPARGLHTSALGWFRELRTEWTARRVRSRRVRPFVAETRTTPAPLVPAPRKPSDDLPRTALSAAVPVVDPREVAEPAAMVRPYFLAHERRQAQRKDDANRLGIAVLWDVAAVQEGAA